PKTRAGRRSATGIFTVANWARHHHLIVASVQGLACPAVASFPFANRIYSRLALPSQNAADIERLSTRRRHMEQCYHGRTKREALRRSEPGRRQIRQDHAARCRGQSVSAATVGRGGGEDRKAARASVGQGGGIQISPRSQEDGQRGPREGSKARIGAGL